MTWFLLNKRIKNNITCCRFRKNLQQGLRKDVACYVVRGYIFLCFLKLSLSLSFGFVVFRMKFKREYSWVLSTFWMFRDGIIQKFFRHDLVAVRNSICCFVNNCFLLITTMRWLLIKAYICYRFSRNGLSVSLRQWRLRKLSVDTANISLFILCQYQIVFQVFSFSAAFSYICCFTCVTMQCYLCEDA